MIHAIIATFFTMVCIIVGLRALEVGWPARTTRAERWAAFRWQLRATLVGGGVLLVGWLLTH